MDIIHLKFENFSVVLLKKEISNEKMLFHTFNLFFNLFYKITPYLLYC